MFLGKDTEAQITLIHPSECVWVWSLENAYRHRIMHCFEFSLGVKMWYISWSIYHLIIKWRKPEKVLYSLIFPFPKTEVSVRFSRSVLQPFQPAGPKLIPSLSTLVFNRSYKCYISSCIWRPAVTVFCTYKLSMKVNDKQWFNDAVPLHYLILCVCVWWGLSGTASCDLEILAVRYQWKHWTSIKNTFEITSYFNY